MSLEAGLAALAGGRFHEAHELVETVWRSASGPRRELLQAVVQLAAALHHHAHGRPGPAAVLLARARGHLEGLPAGAGPPSPRTVSAWVSAAAVALAAGRGPSPPPPGRPHGGPGAGRAILDP